jgi:hypothetical protein
MEKKSDLKSITNQKSGNKRVLEIYKQLLELSNGDLDQYVNEDELNIEKTPMEEYSDIFQEFLDLVSQLYVTHDSEVLIKKFEDVSENKKSKDFLRWLNEYALSLSHIVKETLFIRNMDIGHFSEMAKFCLDNFVLQNSGEFVEENDWNNKQLRILRSIIFSAADLRIVANYSKKYAQKIMYEKLCLDEKYSEIIINIIDENYEKIWRIIFIRRQKSIDDKLDQILRKYQ